MATSPRDHLDRARSADATADELRSLADSPYSFVRTAVAAHPRTPGDVLASLVPEDLSRWSDDEMLAALAEHPHTPPTALTAIAQLVPARLHIRDAPLAFAAGIALLKRTDTPEKVLLDMLQDPQTTTEFRKVAARETTLPALRDFLAGDRSERVRRAAQRPRQTDGESR